MRRLGEEPKGRSPLFALRIPDELRQQLEILAKERNTTVPELARTLLAQPPQIVLEMTSKNRWSFKSFTFLPQPALEKGELNHDSCPFNVRLDDHGKPFYPPNRLDFPETKDGEYLVAYCPKCQRIFWAISAKKGDKRG